MAIAEFLLVVGGAIALALGVHALIRRRVPLEVLEQHHHVAGVLSGVMGGTYGVVLAFVLVSAWQAHERVRGDAASEANAVGDLYRLAGGLSPESREVIRGRARAYLESVIRDEWPAMGDGNEALATHDHLRQLWASVVRLELETLLAQNLHQAMLEQLTTISDARRLRLVAARRSLPGLLWFIIAFGGLATLGFANFFGLRYRRSQALMVAVLTALLASTIFTIHALDRPLRQPLPVSPREVQRVLELMGEG